MKLPHNLQEILRHRRRNFQMLPAHGMVKLQLPGVERLPADPPHIRVIQKIPQKRMSRILHMHPDLVRPPGEQVQPDQRAVRLPAVCKLSLIHI